MRNFFEFNFISSDSLQIWDVKMLAFFILNIHTFFLTFLTLNKYFTNFIHSFPFFFVAFDNLCFIFNCLDKIFLISPLGKFINEDGYWKKIFFVYVWFIENILGNLWNIMEKIHNTFWIFWIIYTLTNIFWDVNII